MINRLAYQIQIINMEILNNNSVVVYALKRKYFMMADYADSVLLLMLTNRYRLILNNSQLIIKLVQLLLII